MCCTKRRNKTYPLLPFSQLVFDMTRWAPWVYMFEVRWCWHGQKKELQRIESAILQVLNHHPVFNMHVDAHGYQSYQSSPAMMKGQYYAIRLWTKGEDVYGRFRWSRILGDGKSIYIFFENVIRAYKGEVLPPDEYLTYLEEQSQIQYSARYANSKTWLETTFADTNVPVRPLIDRKRLQTILPMRVGIIEDDYRNLSADINRFSQDNMLTLDGFFSLCVALAIAEYCDTDSAALTWAYEGRETPMEQHIFGSLHRDIPFQIHRINPATNQPYSRDELVRQARHQVRSGIAHSDYPYTLTEPHNARWDYAVNIIRNQNPDEWLSVSPIPITLLPMPKQRIAYAILDIEICEVQGGIEELLFRYSATHYKKESMQRFAAMIKQYALWLLSK